jgi:hypothetical protein
MKGAVASLILSALQREKMAGNFELEKLKNCT